MKKILLLIFMINLLNACQSVTEGFTLKKNNNADEFLVEKKNPLVLPPGYGTLPIPQDGQINDNEIEDEKIDVFVNKDDKNLSSTVEKDSKHSSIEESILQKIE